MRISDAQRLVFPGNEQQLECKTSMILGLAVSAFSTN